MVGRRGMGLPFILAGVLTAGCGGDGDGDAQRPPPPGGAVSAATPDATEAGVRALALGGNAVDAAVAAALVLGVTEPSESGLGGHAVLLVVPREGEAAVIHADDAQALAGGEGEPALEPPSALAVLGHAWERHGSGNLSWEELVEPAIRAAEEGWFLGRYRHRNIVREYPRLLGDSLTQVLTLNADRSIPTEGTRVTNPALAATLRAVAEGGPATLTSGTLASALAEALEARGYGGAAAWLARPPDVRSTPPISGQYRGRTVLTTPEPFGGPVVLRALAFLESAPDEALRDPGLPRTAWMAEALGWGRSRATDPNAFLAGLPPLPLPGADTLGGSSPASTPDRPPRPAAPPAAPDTSGRGDQTTHVSVLDGAGTAVSVTLSLGRPYGAGFVAGGHGFFPAASPGDAATDRTAVDTAADPGAAREDTAPATPAGGRPGDGDGRWWAAPTVLLRDGRPELVLGSPGGPRGISAIVQVVATWIAGETLPESVEALRIHVEPDAAGRHRLVPEGVVWIDSARSTPRVLAPFGDTLLRPMAAARGISLGEHDSGPLFQDWDPWFGGVHAVAWDGEAWIAAADPRRDGTARTVEPEDVVEATGRAPAGDGGEARGDTGDVSPGGEGADPPQDPGG